MKIHPALIAIMRAANGIGKGRKNTSQGYAFRGIDDVYNSLHEIFADNGVICIPRVIGDVSEERTSKSGSVMIYRILKIEFDLMADDGSKVTFGPLIGEGMDSGDKASNKAMSVAQKYLLLQAFLIPTEEQKDPENESHELKPRPGITDLDPRAKALTAKYKGMADEPKLRAELSTNRAIGYDSYIRCIEAWEV